MYHLGLPGADVGQDPGQAAEEALHNYTYTYPRTGQGSLVGSVRRSQPYRHPICAAIAKELYGGTSINLFVQRHMARFPYTVNPENEKHELEMPPSMVALIFTAVYASLYEWRSGERRPVEFSANMFTDAYHGHIATLKHIKDNRPDAYHKMMHYLWLTAFGSVPQTEPPAMTSMAVIDLDALE
ncbi:hypothetical protein OF83DRAFT_1172143 [Amylostereum chailletii]|nr:hypothetical protein OF83DRAFT_1172143 [Amylostereum chailletii]